MRERVDDRKAYEQITDKRASERMYVSGNTKSHLGKNVREV